MKHIVVAISLFVLLGFAVACDKAPRGVIPESKMESLLVDLEIADAYIESHWDQFPDDSSKLVLKQSIFSKHGVTPELYDTSLVWYARNMDVYIKVYDNAIGRLQKMRNSPDMDSPSPDNGMGRNDAIKRSFAQQGDSADLWHASRRWTLTSGMESGFITFDITPDKEYLTGDRYEFMFKLKPVRSVFRTFMAVDYQDGGTTLVNHFSCNDGWNSLSLQSDSTRTVRRIYGYLYYNITRGDIAYVDSLTLLRTHFDRRTYSAVGGYKTVERIKRVPPAPAEGNADNGNAAGLPAVKHPEGHFKPKEGMNKSSASLHVSNSPNLKHTPNSK